jgi:hypothetical protein
MLCIDREKDRASSPAKQSVLLSPLPLPNLFFGSQEMLFLPAGQVTICTFHELLAGLLKCTSRVHRRLGLSVPLDAFQCDPVPLSCFC